MDFRVLYAALVLSWSDDTGHALYEELCPSRGQCATTALVVNDHYGGRILKCWTEKGEAHYWNELPDGRQVDLTRCQFEMRGDRPLREGAGRLSRKQVMATYRTEPKYEILRREVDRWLERLESASRDAR